MARFETDDVKRLKYLMWIAGIALAVMLVINCTGCSSMSIARQARVGNTISMQLDELHVAIAEACNAGQLSEVNCRAVVKYHKNLLQVHKEYMYSLQALSKGQTTQEQVIFTMNRLQLQLASLVEMLTDYGVLKGAK